MLTFHLLIRIVTGDETWVLQQKKKIQWLLQNETHFFGCWAALIKNECIYIFL